MFRMVWNITNGWWACDQHQVQLNGQLSFEAEYSHSLSPLFNRSRDPRSDVHELTHSHLIREVLTKDGERRGGHASESAREDSKRI